MKPLLVISACYHDIRELRRIPLASPLIFDEYNSEELEKYTYEEGFEEAKSEDIEPLIVGLIQKYKKIPLAGIITSDDYPGSLIASILARALGLIAPPIKTLLTCQHKYYSRIAQSEVVPEAVPKFSLIQEHTLHTLTFPCFVKPVKSYFSCFAQKVGSLEELKRLLPKSLPPPAFLKPLNQLLHAYTSFDITANHLIAEELLSGFQATVEGYAYQGNFGFLGIVDSIMYPGTICFKQFLYPSSIPPQVQKQVEELAERCMRHLGFDNGLFNIEFFYNAEKKSIHIIEINARMAAQFADLYEKVDGTNSYEVAISIATGKNPHVKKRQGLYQVAASCVLREFSNKTMKKAPTPTQINEVQNLYPHTVVEILVPEGKRLSATLQDGKSYRYGLIHLGGKDAEDLEKRLRHCLDVLDIQLE